MDRPVTDPRENFLLVRHGRAVIQDGAMRGRLNLLPKPAETCPVQAALFRRAGIRMADLPEGC